MKRKHLVIGVAVTGLILWGYYMKKDGDVIEYVAPEEVIVEVEKEVQVDALEKAIKEAQASKESEIKSTAQQAYDEAYNQEMKKVELEVIQSFNDKLDARQIELEKETKEYWRDRANIVYFVKQKAKEYGVSAYNMLAVIGCESGYVVDVQSKHVYTEKNVPKGYKVGDREQSYGLVQIHLPAHPNITKEQATDPEFAIDFLARNLKTNPSMWSCYKTVAMR